jgi:hypothetical protein
MSIYEPNDSAAGIPLEAHVAELRRRREAAARLYDGSTYFREECEIFNQYAREKDCYLARPPQVVDRPPDDEGNEHQVAISDTHRGNLILMSDGLLAPIDLRIQPLDGVLLEQAHQLCREARSN